MMTCEKCGKVYSSERPYLKHIENCKGPIEKKEFPNPSAPSASSTVSARVAKEYEAMLSLLQISLLGFSQAVKKSKPDFSLALTKDALTIEKEKKSISQGVGEFAGQHSWVEPAMKKVLETFSVMTLLAVHAPLVEGVVKNHAAPIDVSYSERTPAAPRMEEFSA